MNLKDQIKAAEKAIKEGNKAVRAIRLPHYKRVNCGCVFKDSALDLLGCASTELQNLKDHLGIK